MTLLPIVDRELRIAARRKQTFWLRLATALVALVITAGFFLLLTATPFGGAAGSVGGPLFSILTWLSFLGTLSAGVFFTADCLSEEKREGTLGFLFLTDLRSYDVVFGKLFATSLRCAFALLTVFPILAVTQLLGGVTGEQFWKTALALVNALLVSLATGMFVSSLSRDGQKALLATVVCLLFWLFGGLVLDRICAGIYGPRTEHFFELASPLYVFRHADYGEFWRPLLFNQVIVWGLLGATCFLVRRTWQDRGSKTSMRWMRWRYDWRYGGEKWRRRRREKLMEPNPMLWLACRERWAHLLSWGITLFLIAIFIGMLLREPNLTDWILWRSFNGAISLALYLILTVQAAQFFAEARHTRSVELLLASPLQVREIVTGVWRGLLRRFVPPVLAMIATKLLALFLTLHTLPAAAGVGGFPSQPFDEIITGLMEIPVLLANLVALAWFGLWMGMVSKNAMWATLKTLLFVQIIPWFVITVWSALAVFSVMLPSIKSGTGSATAMVSFTLLNAGVHLVLVLGKDFFFWHWARKRLLRDFRNEATRTVLPIVLAPPKLATPPPLIPKPQ